MELSFNFRKIDLKGIKVNLKAILCVFLSVLMVFSSFAVTPFTFDVNANTVSGGNVTGSNVTGGNVTGGDVHEKDYARSGDVDRDGAITAFDSRLALRASVALEKLTAEQATLADVDMDGKITSSDARLILRASVGLEHLIEKSTGISVIPPEAAQPYNDFLTLHSEVHEDKLIVTVNARDLFYLNSGNFELNYDSSLLAFPKIEHDSIDNENMFIGSTMYAENTDEAGKIRFAYSFKETAGVSFEEPKAIVTIRFDILSDTSTTLTLSGKMFIDDERYTLENALTVYTGDSSAEEMTADLRLLENSKDKVKVQLSVKDAAELEFFDLQLNYSSSVLKFEDIEIASDMRELVLKGHFMTAFNGNTAGLLLISGALLYPLGTDAETAIYTFTFSRINGDSSDMSLQGAFEAMVLVPSVGEETTTEEPSTDLPEEPTGDFDAALSVLENNEDTVKVQLTVKNAAELEAFDLQLNYSSSVLKFEDFEIASDLSELVLNDQFMTAVNGNTAGLILIAGVFDYSLGTDEETAIYTFTFSRIKGDSSDMSLQGAFEAMVVVPSVGEETTTEPEEITGHTHSFSREVIIEPGCDTIGEQEFTCSCGEIYRGIIPATGHSDDDSDGICDNCEKHLEEGGNGNSLSFLSLFFAKIASFFERIIEFFKNIFNF